MTPIPASGRHLLLAATVVAMSAAPAAGREFGHVWRVVAAPFQAAHRMPPPPEGDPCVKTLADQLAWLEHHLDCHGSIVAKQPDVWGQSRLTRARLEYEEEMRKQLGQFTERTSAAIRRSDQAYLGMALALQSASGRRRAAPETAVPEATGSASVINTIQGLIPSGNETAGRGDPVVIARTAPFALPPNPAGMQFDGDPVSLEPSVHLDQLSRYLNHLAELRRVNEGDDSADSPGYSLNLVRIPVSVIPGACTRKGYGAEITVIAEPCLGADLLPATFRSLVINDLIDMIAPALTWAVNDRDCLQWADTIVTGDTAALAVPRTASAAALPEPGTPSPVMLASGARAFDTLSLEARARDRQGLNPVDPTPRQGVMAAMQSLRAKLPTAAPSSAPGLKTRRSRMPIPFSQLVDVAGIGQIAILIRDTHAALANLPENRPCIGYMQVRGHLHDELDAAYDFLSLDVHEHVWRELPGWNLASLVRGRQSRELAAARCRFFDSMGTGASDGIELPLAEPAGICCEPDQPAAAICRTTTAVLAWAILVESALLDGRLAADTREAATSRGQAAPLGGCAGPFFGPDPPPEARVAFADYVRVRWPLRVFALDPVSEEQNVDDSYARRRELQIAMAMASASGPLNAQAMQRYTRRLELDMATIQLNKTAVGFSHSADTFGWRFYPRVQTPPTRGGLAAFGETVCGPSSDADLAQRQLEPGQRECVAIIVMPAFVPWVNLDVRTTWFSLTHPKDTDPGMRESLRLSRAIQAVQATGQACSRCPGHAAGADVAHLLRRADALSRRLPLQSLQAQIPRENTAGGFELFNAGITDLAPELLGWYGAPGVDPATTTALFLIGKGFSIHDTRVIAGGKPARFQLLSREILQVEIPAGAATVDAPGCTTAAAAPRFSGPAAAGVGLASHETVETLPEPATPATGPCTAGGPADPAACGIDCNRREVVEVHLATPYGVTSHLLVPVVRRIEPGDGPAFSQACTLGLSFTVTKSTATRAEAARMDEFFSSSCDALEIRVPESFIPPAKSTLRLLVRNAGSDETAATFSFDDPPFDARRSCYVIAGGDLRNFVGDTSRPATDKTLRGAVKPYLDTLLLRGQLADDGDDVTLLATATLASGDHDVPVGGEITVRAVRRGRTTVEPAPADVAP
ncbi:MAG: hypothetical protein ACKO4Z_10620 [Planctomycetota bacterium]